MPTERTFDYEYLRGVKREHPSWTLRQLADAVTQHERLTRRDDTYPRVTTHAIRSVLHRYGDAWREQGDIIVQSAKSPTARSQPFANLPQEFSYDQMIQNLRVLNAIRDGDEARLDPGRVRMARNMEARLVEAREVIDLDPDSKPPFRPYVRPARLDEIDGEGNLITITARYPGLTDYQRKELGNPRMRAVMAAKWIREGDADAMVAV
jgi:hypothetical protein